LKLYSVGKVRNAQGKEIYSIWRVRNGSDISASMSLRAHGNPFTVDLEIPAKSDMFVRSTFVTGRATHALFHDGRQIEVKESCSTPFVSDLLVPNPSCQGDNPLKVIGETGTVSVSSCDRRDSWRTVKLRRSFKTPVVIMSTFSRKDSAPTTVRVKNVQSNSFEYSLQEWDYLDGRHGTESVEYLVVEKGRYKIEEGLEVHAGISQVTDLPTSVNFTSQFTGTPLVLSQVMSSNDCAAVTARHDSVSNLGFTLRLQEEEKPRTHSHGLEQVGWVAVSLGATEKCMSMRLDQALGDAPKTIPLTGLVLHSNPALFAQTASFRESDTGTVRWLQKSTQSCQLIFQEEKSKDQETTHVLEDLGILVLEATREIKGLEVR